MTHSVPFDLSPEAAQRILRDGYGVAATSINFVSGELATVCCVTDSRGTWALKVVPQSAHEAEIFRWQAAVMAELKRLNVPVPMVVPDRTGSVVHETQGERGALALLTAWLHDPPLSAVHVDPSLLREVGKTAAKVSVALESQRLPSRVDHPWELTRTSQTVRSVLHQIADPATREIAEAGLGVFVSRVEPVLSDLPWALVHHDLHDSNLLVGHRPDGTRTITGVLDFGDLVFAPRLAELAVAAAYASRHRRDAAAALVEVAVGWTTQLPLTDEERRTLLPAAIARLTTNVAVWTARAGSARAEYAALRVEGALETLQCLLATDSEAFVNDLNARLPRAVRTSPGQF
jgi:hydroxylysine kinase